MSEASLRAARAALVCLVNMVNELGALPYECLCEDVKERLDERSYAEIKAACIRSCREQPVCAEGLPVDWEVLARWPDADADGFSPGDVPARDYRAEAEQACEGRWSALMERMKWLAPNPKLPPDVLIVPEAFFDLALLVIRISKDSPELVKLLDGLLATKDCAVRAAMGQPR